jgi:hypothetical protein
MHASPSMGPFSPGAPAAGALPARGPERSGGARLIRALLGRPFLNTSMELMLIGGGLSIVATVTIALVGPRRPLLDPALLPWIVLLSNSAHFAASSVRLYTKPGAARSMPITALGLPVAAAALFILGLAFPGGIGAGLNTLYLTWSPFHYSAQAYGVAMIYTGRAGRSLTGSERRLLRAIALVPFAYTAVRFLSRWTPALVARGLPSLAEPERGLGLPLIVAGLGAPILFHAIAWRRHGTPLPLMCLLPLVSNALWFFVLDPLNAFLWATIFHGIQYMALVLIFHVRDGVGANPGAGREHAAALGRLAAFYLGSVALGYGLFIVLPAVGAAIGGDYPDSRMIAVALVNIHHFLVDARIWHLSRGDGNRRIVEGEGRYSAP